MGLFMYLSNFRLTTIENWFGLVSMFYIWITTSVFIFSFKFLMFKLTTLAYALMTTINIRLDRNNASLTVVKRKCKASQRRLARFQLNHTGTMIIFFDFHRKFSLDFFQIIATFYTMSTLLLANLARQSVWSLVDVYILLMVNITMAALTCVHLLIAHQNKRFHSPFAYFLPAVSVYCKVRGGGGWNAHIRSTLFGQGFHTKRRYGLQYGPIGLVNMAAFAKVSVLSEKVPLTSLLPPFLEHFHFFQTVRHFLQESMKE